VQGFHLFGDENRIEDKFLSLR